MKQINVDDIVIGFIQPLIFIFWVGLIWQMIKICVKETPTFLRKLAITNILLFFFFLFLSFFLHFFAIFRLTDFNQNLLSHNLGPFPICQRKKKKKSKKPKQLYLPTSITNNTDSNPVCGTNGTRNIC